MRCINSRSIFSLIDRVHKQNALDLKIKNIITQTTTTQSVQDTKTSAFIFNNDGEQRELSNKYDNSQNQEPPKPGKCFSEVACFSTMSPTRRLANILP